MDKLMDKKRVLERLHQLAAIARNLQGRQEHERGGSHEELVRQLGAELQLELDDGEIHRRRSQ